MTYEGMYECNHGLMVEQCPGPHCPKDDEAFSLSAEVLPNASPKVRQFLFHDRKMWGHEVRFQDEKSYTCSCGAHGVLY